jgi:CHAD domain-containing protein
LPLLTIKSFIAKVRSYGRGFKKKLEKYVRNTNEKNIHDIRTSTRRLHVTYSLLTKKIHSRPDISNYFRLSKVLFKYNSGIRDIDIICQHLKYYENEESDRVQKYLIRKRAKKLKSAIDLAVQMKVLPLPEIDEKYLCTKKVQSKFAKEKEKLLNKIVRNIPTVTSDPRRIEELHELRKSSKKLRYLLELLPKQDEAVSKLTKIQDKLGSIHDFDITIAFLKRCKQDSMVQNIIQSETYERNNKFQEFANSMTGFLDSNDKDNILNI